MCNICAVGQREKNVSETCLNFRLILISWVFLFDVGLRFKSSTEMNENIFLMNSNVYDSRDPDFYLSMNLFLF